jgi:hypothetical protein
MLRRFFAVATLLVVAAYPARAERIEFLAQHAGERVEGAEICFYRAGATSEPFERFLVSPEVRCFSADQVLLIPGGRWTYYTRHLGRSLVSTSPAIIDHPPTTEFDHTYRQTVEEMLPAGAIDVSDARKGAHEGENLAVYVSNGGTDWLPTIIPIPPGENSVLVPADMPLLLLRTTGTRVLAVSDPITVGVRKRVAVSFPSRQMPGHVLTWVQFPEDARAAGEYWTRMPAPELRLRSASALIEPAIAPRSAFGADGALFLFRNVPPGPWRISLSGAKWKRGDIAGDMPSSPTLMITTRPIMTEPAAALRVQWPVPRATPAVVDCGNGKDDSRKDDAAEALLLLSCPGLQPGDDPANVALDSCNIALRAESIDFARSEGTFHGVPAGTYLVILNRPGFDDRPQTVSLQVGDAKELTLPVAPFELFGKVTVDNEPIRARIEFATGVATSDDSGQYYATLAAPPRKLPIKVRSCSGELLHTELPRTPLGPNRPYDISISTNTLTVQVLDRTTRQPISGANLQVGALLSGDQGAFLDEISPTDAAGKAVVRNAPPSLDLLVCAVAQRYTRACAERLRLGAKKEHLVKIELAPEQFTNRFKLSRQIEWGFVFFVAPSGQVTERARVAADGSFTYRDIHRAPEHLVFVSTLPMVVLPLPETFQPNTDILWPTAAVRALSVSIGPRSSQNDALIGLFVGGRYVPAEALSHHQSNRDFQTDIYDRGPLYIRDILETGPVSVVLGPSPTALPMDMPPGVDIFTLPFHLNTFPRKAADTGSAIVFD